jgi:hypothetical protein
MSEHVSTIELRDVLTEMSYIFREKAAEVPISPQFSDIRMMNALIYPDDRPKGLPKSPRIQSATLFRHTAGIHSRLLDNPPPRQTYRSTAHERDFTVPIGEYGANFAVANILATRHVSRLFAQLMPKECGNLAKRYPRVIEKTFRQNPLITGIESFRANSQSISVLTSQKVHAFEHNPADLIKASHSQGLFSELSLRMLPGMLIDMVVSGHTFKNPVSVKSSNEKNTIQLELDEEMKEQMSIERHYRRNHQENGQFVTLSGCPVGRHNAVTTYGVLYETGVDMSLEVHIKYLEAYYEALKNTKIVLGSQPNIFEILLERQNA